MHDLLWNASGKDDAGEPRQHPRENHPVLGHCTKNHMDALVAKSLEAAAANKRKGVDAPIKTANLAINFVKTILPLATRHEPKTQWINSKALLTIPNCAESLLNCALSESTRSLIQASTSRLSSEWAADISSELDGKEKRSKIGVAGQRAERYFRISQSFPNLAQPGVLDKINTAVKNQAKKILEEESPLDTELKIILETANIGLSFTIDQIRCMGWMTDRADQNPYKIYFKEIAEGSQKIGRLLHKLNGQA
jgi:hypothetical protein